MLSLFTDDVILYVESLKIPHTKKLTANEQI